MLRLVSQVLLLRASWNDYFSSEVKIGKYWIKESSFADFTSTGDGGAISLKDSIVGALLVEKCDFNSIFTDGNGGCISYQSPTKSLGCVIDRVTAVNCACGDYNDNTESDGSFSYIHLPFDAKVKNYNYKVSVTGCPPIVGTISRNHSILVKGGNLKVDDVNISYTKQTYAGLCLLKGQGNCTVSFLSIMHNTASISTFISLWDTQYEVTCSQFINNTQSAEDGVIYVDRGANVVMKSCYFKDNSESFLFCVWNGSLTIESCYIVGSFLTTSESVVFTNNATSMPNCPRSCNNDDTKTTGKNITKIILISAGAIVVIAIALFFFCRGNDEKWNKAINV